MRIVILTTGDGWGNLVDGLLLDDHLPFGPQCVGPHTVRAAWASRWFAVEVGKRIVCMGDAFPEGNITDTVYTCKDFDTISADMNGIERFPVRVVFTMAGG